MSTQKSSAGRLGATKDVGKTQAGATTQARVNTPRGAVAAGGLPLSLTDLACGKDDVALSSEDLNLLQIRRTEFKSRMNAARSNRRKADNDVQMLANRIALLKFEMSKSQRKIQETHQRTMQVKCIQEDNVRRIQEKERAEAVKEARRRELQKKFERQKQELAQARDVNVSRMIEKKRQEVEEVKKTRKVNLDRIKKQREAERMRAVKNKNIIQKQRTESRKKLKQCRTNKLRRIRQDVTAKIRQEDEMAREKERMIEQMEQEELLLIEHLQKTQQSQKVAYEHLEKTLNQSHLPHGS